MNIQSVDRRVILFKNKQTKGSQTKSKCHIPFELQNHAGRVCKAARTVLDPAGFCGCPHCSLVTRISLAPAVRQRLCVCSARDVLTGQFGKRHADGPRGMRPFSSAICP